MRRGLPVTVVALGFTSLFADVGSEMIFPLLPAFLASIGGTPAFLGLIEGISEATSSLTRLASGYAADHSGRKKPFVVFGYGLSALVRPIVALASAPWQVLAIRTTDRLGKGIRSAPRDVLIAGSVPHEETGRAFGFHRAMDHAGAVIGPLIAAALIGFGLELRTVFLLAIIPGVLSVVAVLTVREPAAAAVASPAPIMPTVPAASSGRLPPALRSYLGILLLFSIGNSSDAFLLLRAEELGVSLALLPLLWTAFHVSKLVSSYLGGSWSDRIARPKLIVSGWVLYAAAYLAFGVATQAWHAWAIFIVYGGYYGLTEPAEKALVKDLAPVELRGRAYGFYSFILGIAAIPAGVLTGWLWQTWSPQVALCAGAAVAVVSSIALMIWERRRAVQGV